MEIFHGYFPGLFGRDQADGTGMGELTEQAVVEKYISDNDKILIMKPSSLGDIVHTIPVVQAIRRTLPSVYISWFVLKEYKPMVDMLRDVDETIPFTRYGFVDSPLNYINSQLATIKRLRKERFTWVLDFQGLFRSGLFAYLSGASKRFGFRWKNEPNRFFYNVWAQIDKREHALVRTIGLARRIGIRVEPKDLVARFESCPPPAIDFPETEAIVFCPGGRWVTKRWPAENYAELARYVVERLGMNVILVGSKFESGLGQKIKGMVKEGVIDLVGKTTLGELPYILKKAEAVVTNDSGPMHLAAALGTRVFALFGPTDPSRTGPFGEGHVVFTANVDCRPCFKKNCDRGEECMRKILVDRVAEKLEMVFGSS